MSVRVFQISCRGSLDSRDNGGERFLEVKLEMDIYQKWEKGDRQGKPGCFGISGFCGDVEMLRHWLIWVAMGKHE